MVYRVNYSEQFEDHYLGLKEEDQDKIDDFVDLFEVNGFKPDPYPGIFKPTCTKIGYQDPNYECFVRLDLYHYHVGIPRFETRKTDKMTSDWVLHILKVDMSTIFLIDLTMHSDSSGRFNFPSKDKVKINFHGFN